MIPSGQNFQPVREHAMRALSSIGESAKAALPALISGLQDADTEVRAYAAFALAKIGQFASDAVPALIEALADVSERVRQHAMLALNQIGTAEAKKALGQL